MKLTQEQKNKLLAWAVEGLRLSEIKDRAAREQPAFTVSWPELKHARKKSGRYFRALCEQFDAEAMQEGLARKAVRLAQKMDRHALLRRVIEERGKDEDMQRIAGGKTGLLVRDYKGAASLPVYKLDGALLKELRDLEREIAIELGQWTEKRELTGADGAPLLDPLVAALEKAYGNSSQCPTETD